MWPLGFWLPATYAAAAPPVAALFAIMTKVGVYVILRLSLLLFGDGAGASARLRRELAAVWRHGDARLRHDRRAGLAEHWRGSRASACWSRRARCSPSIGYENAGVTAGALFYLVSSTLAHRRLLPAGRTGRARPRRRRGRAGRHARSLWRRRGSDEHDEEVGVAIPGDDGDARHQLSPAARCCSPACRRCRASSASSRCSAPCSTSTASASAGIAAGDLGGWSALLIVSGLAALIAHDPRRHQHLLGRRSTATCRACGWSRWRRSLLLLGLCLAAHRPGRPGDGLSCEAAASALHAPMRLCRRRAGRRIAGEARHEPHPALSAAAGWRCW